MVVFEVLSIDILFGGILQVLSLAMSNQGSQIEEPCRRAPAGQGISQM